MAADEKEQKDPEEKKRVEGDELRRLLGEAYSFVRSREVNRQIASFTLDHYIEEEMHKIKSSRILRNIAGKDKSGERAYGSRPSQLEEITGLRERLKSKMKALEDLAEETDREGRPAEGQP